VGWRRATRSARSTTGRWSSLPPSSSGSNRETNLELGIVGDVIR
jgi:hypothetical protein